MVIVFAIQCLLLVIPIAFGFTISALVGQAIGSGEIAKARRIMWICLVTCLLTMTFLVILILLFGQVYISGMVVNEVIIGKAFSNLKVYTIVFIVDGLQ